MAEPITGDREFSSFVDDNDAQLLLAADNEADDEAVGPATWQSDAADRVSEPTPLSGRASFSSVNCAHSLALVCLGLVSAVAETRAWWTRQEAENSAKPVEWVCWSLKCFALSAPSIAGLLYLRLCARSGTRIPLAKVSAGDESRVGEGRRRFWLIADLPKRLRLTKELEQPSAFLLCTSVFFAFASCLSMSTEIVCGLIEFSLNTKNLYPLAEAFRRLLLMIFVVLQSHFFVVNSGVVLNVCVGSSSVAVSHLIGANVADWIFNVGFEIRHALKGSSSNNFSNVSTPFCHVINEDVVRSLYPFLAEYYLMSSLFASSFLNGVGRLAELAADGRDLRRLLLTQRTTTVEADAGVMERLRSLAGMLHSGLFLVVAGLVVGFIVRLLDGKGKEWRPTAELVFNIGLICLHTCGIVLAMLMLMLMLMRRGGCDSGVVRLKNHSTDRLLLWVGVSAVMVNDIYLVWQSLEDLQLLSRLSQVSSCLLNVCFSVIQVVTLECLLALRLKPSRLSLARSCLLLLMLLNVSEWLLYTVCFDFLFPTVKGEGLVIAVSTMPLLVFFRFHVFGCFEEFRHYCAGYQHQHQHQHQDILVCRIECRNLPSVTE